MTYYEKLRDPRWQKKRLEIMQRDEFMCRDCCSTTETLNVHHVAYKAKTDPWDYPDSDLVTLCEDCHETRHAEQRELLQLIQKHDCLRGLLIALKRLEERDRFEIASWISASKFPDLLAEAWGRVMSEPLK